MRTSSARNVAWLLALALLGCRHIPTQKELDGALIHYDLGIQSQQSGDVQSAYREFQTALELDPNLVEAHNAIAVLLHLSFKKPDEAIVHYKRALELRPTFSEVKTNLANVYLEQERYDEAIALYQEALNDMLYSTPFIAQGNLGWAFYKRGDARRGDLQRAVESIKAAVTTNPRFCLGYKNLGIIEKEQGNVQDSCKHFSKYRENCPDVADAWYRDGICLANQGDNAGARKAFAACQTRKPSDSLKEDCKQLLEHLQ